MPPLPGAFASRADRFRLLTQNEQVRLARMGGLPVHVVPEGRFDATRHIPLPWGEGLYDGVAAIQPGQDLPPARWHDVSDVFDLDNLGRDSRTIGEADGNFGRPVPLFASPGRRLNDVRRSGTIRDLQVMVTGGAGTVAHVDAGSLYRGQPVPSPRRVAATHALAFPLLDILRVFSNRVPNQGSSSPYPAMELVGDLPATARLLTTLGNGHRGLVPGTQFDLSLTLSVASVGGVLSPPLLRFPAADGNIGADGVFCAVARLDPANLRAVPLLTGSLAPAWGLVAGNFERVVAPGGGEGVPLQRDGRDVAPFAGTLRTLPRRDEAGRNVITGAGAQESPVSVMDGIDLSGFRFAPGAPEDPNRVRGANALQLYRGRMRRYAQRRVRITLSFTTLPVNVDNWVPDPPGGQIAFGKTALLGQASLIWLETQRESPPGAAPPSEPARWQAWAMQTPRYLDVAHPHAAGERHVYTGPDSAVVTGLYAPDFDHAVVVGGFSSFVDGRRGFRLQIDDVQARIARFVDPRVTWVGPGVPDAASWTISRVRDRWNGQISREDFQ